MTSKLSPPSPTAVTDPQRELKAAREIAHAFLTATRPAEVYRLALERVAPLVGATFGCVFLREQGTDLLHVVAEHNWPRKFAPYLDTMRIRVGNGPTGRAVAENRLIEVAEVFGDSTLKDWWESARELGFVSSVAVPLSCGGDPVGALTFYFEKSPNFSDADRSLIRLVADQLAATAEKAHLIEDLQRTNDLLREQNVDLEARYREAEEARRLKTEFLANVSHELRTPLTAILGYAYLLREGVNGEVPPEQSAALAKIESAGTSLLALIDDLLDLTHLKLGRTTVEPELCDAVALMRAAISAVPAPAAIEVQAEEPPARIPIHTDPTLVLRILQNIIANAYKFTPEGTVTVRVLTDAAPGPGGGAPNDAARGGRVLWQVQDTGIGIAPENQAAIFQEFRQVDGSATRRFSGAGLGLALSKGLANRLGGDITVDSTAGEGSTFTLALPSSVVHAGATATTPTTS